MTYVADVRVRGATCSEASASCAWKIILHAFVWLYSRPSTSWKLFFSMWHVHPESFRSVLTNIAASLPLKHLGRFPMVKKPVQAANLLGDGYVYLQ